MNFAALTPRPVVPRMSQAMKVTAKGNLFKVKMYQPTDGSINSSTAHHEVWMTKEAVQKHFGGMTTEPENYQYKQFAKKMYQQQLAKHNGAMPHNAMLVTSEGTIHGERKLWPTTLIHHEVKL